MKHETSFMLFAAAMLHDQIQAQDMVNTDAGSELYITNIEKKDGNIVEVTTKTKAINGRESDYRNDVINARKAHNEHAANKVAVTGFDKLDHTLCKTQYDCVNKKYRYAVYTYYEKDDKVIENTNYDDKTPWENPPEGSLHEALLSQVACR